MITAGFYQRKWLFTRLPVFGLAVLAANWLWLFAYPVPDSKITITSGAADGACCRNAQRYAVWLSECGVTPVIQTSAGS